MKAIINNSTDASVPLLYTTTVRLPPLNMYSIDAKLTKWACDLQMQQYMN